MNVREYVIFLHNNSERKLSKKLCSFYIAKYERARFSMDEFSLEEYNDFMKKFHKILKCFIKKQSKKKLSKKILRREDNSDEDFDTHSMLSEITMQSVDPDREDQELLEPKNRKKKKKNKSEGSQLLDLN
jgi:hypothetical protein